MLWPFNHFRKPRLSPRGTIETIYGMIVTRAREPLFYRDLGVSDTVNGRFDLLILHLWMVLRRLRPMEGGVELAQALFDRFCADMDANLREMGVAFYGRAAAYDLALTEGEEALAQALRKNVLDGARPDEARRLAAYVEIVIKDLAARDDAALLSAQWAFPLPEQEIVRA
jgi:cytochrome b pre-mRNA-processing protein 3